MPITVYTVKKKHDATGFHHWIIYDILFLQGISSSVALLQPKRSISSSTSFINYTAMTQLEVPASTAHQTVGAGQPAAKAWVGILQSSDGGTRR